MKKLLFLLLLACVLASCASHRLTNAEKYPALSGMINAYYYRYYEYPSSADELITFTNVYREYWSKESVKDSIETTLNHLQKEKEKLLWHCNKTYPWEETDLTILSNNDTILKDSYPIESIVAENGMVVKLGRNFTGSSWGDLLDLYIIDYFKFPNSLEDLIEYSRVQDLIDIETQPIDKSSEGMGVFGYYENLCDAAAFRYFLNHLDEMVWHSYDTSLLIMVNTDTIFFDYIAPDCPCHSYDYIPWDMQMFTPRFYDLEGHIEKHYIDDFLTREFRNKTLRYFRILYPLEMNTNYYNNFHFLQYTQNEGLSVLCKDDDMNPNTEYFKHLERYVKSFAEKNKFGKIVFVAPELNDTEISERNVMRIYLDGNNKILVNGKETQLEELKGIVKNFITPHPDDDTAPEVEWKTFDLIGSIQVSKGIVFFDTNRNAKYAIYLDVQKEVLQSFNELKEELSIKTFQKSYDKLDEEQTKNINNAVPIRILEDIFEEL